MRLWLWLNVFEPIEWRLHVWRLKRRGKWCHDCDAPSVACACAPGN